MNRYEKFEQLIKRTELAAEEIRKSWKSESAELFLTSFDDSVEFVKKMTDSVRDELERENVSEDRETLSGFSFD